MITTYAPPENAMIFRYTGGKSTTYDLRSEGKSRRGKRQGGRTQHVAINRESIGRKRRSYPKTTYTTYARGAEEVSMTDFRELRLRIERIERRKERRPRMIETTRTIDGATEEELAALKLHDLKGKVLAALELPNRKMKAPAVLKEGGEMPHSALFRALSNWYEAAVYLDAVLGGLEKMDELLGRIESRETMGPPATIWAAGKMGGTL